VGREGRKKGGRKAGGRPVDEERTGAALEGAGVNPSRAGGEGVAVLIHKSTASR
jgi:hypothetical protein